MFNDDNLPPGLEQEDWDEFIEHRKELKKPLTDRAKRRMLMKLHRMREAGEPLDQVIDRAIVNGWQDVYPIPPELRLKKQKEFYQAKEPEPEVSDEKAAENVRYLHDALNGAMKIQGGGR